MDHPTRGIRYLRQRQRTVRRERGECGDGQVESEADGGRAACEGWDVVGSGGGENGFVGEQRHWKEVICAPALSTTNGPWMDKVKDDSLK